ncbi:hypothetical protein M569_07622, partial [Genlisea aurea]
MGSSQSHPKKNKSSTSTIMEALKKKVKFLEEEIHDVMCIREAENKVYERELVGFAFRQAEWKRERKKLKDEIRRLRCSFFSKTSDFLLPQFLSSLRDDNGNNKCKRDETVEKWKQLYFVVKLELDNLIARTGRGGGGGKDLEEEEDDVMEVRKELKEKGDKIRLLQSMLIAMEEEEFKRNREIDILRQSLKIVAHTTTTTN